MSKKNKKNQNEEAKLAQEELQDQEALNIEQQVNDNEKDDLAKRIAELEEQLEHEKNEHLYKLAEFDNFRKRTLNEKAELIKNGAESAMRDLLPVVDDLERALEAIN